MTKLSELQKAVANRNFEHDAIEEDLEFVEDQFDAFRKYFNAVYEDICAGETAKVFLERYFYHPDAGQLNSIRIK